MRFAYAELVLVRFAGRARDATDAVAQPSDSTVPKNSGRFVCVSTMA